MHSIWQYSRSLDLAVKYLSELKNTGIVIKAAMGLEALTSKVIIT